MANAIIDTFDLWTTAQDLKTSNRGLSASNQSLLGIKRLRELILELALQGKLTQSFRDSHPELVSGPNSAKTILEKINTERLKNFKEGKIKKPAFSPEVSENEKPFALPEEWEWVRLQQIIQISSGDGLIASNMDSNGTIPVFGGNGINGYHNKGNITKPTIVIGRVGFYCGSIHITPKLAWVTDNAFITTFSEDNIDINFLFWLLRGTNLKENENATAQPVISGRKVYPIVVGFPPLAEQHRIVAKVDELMALCDQLEQQQNSSNEVHQTLVDTLLGTLTKAENPAAFEEAWQRIANHFDTLLTTEHSINQLKQTILQLAVMGKLVPQNPDDEPASELLKRIGKEKERLVKEGKIKKQPPLPQINKDEVFFTLPKGWTWERLGSYGIVFSGGSFKSEDFNTVAGTKVIKITNAGVGELIETEDFLPEHFVSEYNQYVVKENDLILALTRPYISSGLKISRCPKSYNNSLLNQRVASIRLITEVEYVFLYLQSSFVLNSYMERFGNSGLQPNLKISDVTDLVLPIPPESEQLRIVSKVDELFALCDALKERLRDAQALQNQLAMAVV